MNRAPDTRFSDMLMRMRRRDRLALSESVARLLRETAPAEPAPVLTDEVATQYTTAKEGDAFVNSKGESVFKRKPVGWLTTVRISLKGVLTLVKDTDGKADVASEFRDAKDGEEVFITKGLLIDPALANETGGLRFKKKVTPQGDRFIDEKPVPQDKLVSVVEELKLTWKPASGTSTAAGAPAPAPGAPGAAPAPGAPAGAGAAAAGKEEYLLADGDIKFVFDKTRTDLKPGQGVLRIIVDTKDEGFSAFDDLFGSGSGIASAIARQTARSKSNRVSIEISASAAEGNAILKQIPLPFSGKMEFIYDQTKQVAKFAKLIDEKDWEKISRSLTSVESMSAEPDKVTQPDLRAVAPGGTINVKIEGKDLKLIKLNVGEMLVDVPLSGTDIGILKFRNQGAEATQDMVRVDEKIKASILVEKADVIPGIFLRKMKPNRTVEEDNGQILLKTGDNEFKLVLTYDQVIKAKATKVQPKEDEE